MSNEIATVDDFVYSLETGFNNVNAYKLNFKKEANFALQILKANDFLRSKAQANPSSLQNAITNIAAIGISLNPALKEAYLTPRGNQVCLDISYIGLVKLATDTGSIDWVQAEIVKANDTFEYQGVGKTPIHKMNPFSDRGETIGVYCVAKLSTGEHLSTIMSKAECDSIRDKSSQASKNGPWVTFYEEMLKKTVIKRASKLWPKSERVQNAVDVINEHDGIEFNNNVPHVDPSAYDSEAPTPEKIDYLKNLIVSKGKTVEGLLSYLNTQFKTNIESINDLNSAQYVYSERILGGKK